MEVMKLEPNENGLKTGDVQGETGDRRVWSVDEAARILGISRAHAYELVARQELRSVRLGRRIVVPKRAVSELLGEG
jgi:excisionase family DNA binding protein